MTITINVDTTQQEHLLQEAKRRGLTVEEYAAGVLYGQYPSLREEMTPAQILEELKQEGIIPMWQDRQEDTATLAYNLRYPNSCIARG